MQALIRCKCWTLTLKFHDVILHPTLSLDNLSFVRHKAQAPLSQIPDAEKLIEKALLLKNEEIIYKRNLLNEFFSECCFQNSDIFELKVAKKFSLISVPIQYLEEKNWVSSVNNTTDHLLSCLEPFPFDREEILKKEESGKLSLNFIRNSIERQYLAWKYQVDVKDVKEIFFRFRGCFYLGRSLTSLKKNVSLLETVPHMKEKNVAEKIYHLYQKPFCVENVYNFQDKVAGLIWHVFPHHCKKVLLLSHQLLLSVVSILEMLEFTEKQIQMGLPFLNSNFLVFIYKLNYLLDNPKLKKYKNDTEFLQLLYFRSKDLSDLVNLRSYEELLEFVKLFGKKVRSRLVSKSSVEYLIFQTYNTHYRLIKPYSHRHFRLVPEMQIHESLTFLKETGFTFEEVEESLDIIFYPRELIEKCFEEINENFKEIRDSNDETVYFKNGIKGKRKVLQLCLYLMDKPYDFSGEGVWSAKEPKNVSQEL